MSNWQEHEPAPWIGGDETAVLRSFLESGVRFVIVGGRAVRFHGYDRPATDLDLLVEFSSANWHNLHRALRPLNASVPAFYTLSAEKRYQARLNFYPTVELLTAIDGVSFAQAWTDATGTTVQDMQVRVISRAHLIRSKQASPRPLDAQDVAALRALR